MKSKTLAQRSKQMRRDRETEGMVFDEGLGAALGWDLRLEQGKGSLTQS